MRSFQITLVALLASAVGCGSDYDGPPTFGASGVVTYQGQPAAGCLVILSPTQVSVSDRSFSVQGTTDEQGRFILKTSNRTGTHYELGAVEGAYSVAITKYEDTLVSGNKPLKNYLPTKYSRPTTSQLEAEITPEGPNEFFYDLQD